MQQPQPLRVFSLAAPADDELLLRWETHLYPLHAAGNLYLLSMRNIQAGSERDAEMFSLLHQAQLIILLLSPDFFFDEHCYASMLLALKQQQNSHARVVSLLLRPVDWRESPVKELVFLPSSGLPVTRYSDIDQGLYDCENGLRRLIGLSMNYETTFQKSVITRGEQRNRIRMLQRLRHIYTEISAQFLPYVTSLHLEFVTAPSMIQNTTSLLLPFTQRTEQPLPSGVSIVQAYDQAAHELLILGEPGAGKSTLLLQLAHTLVEQAEQDYTSPLPVLLPLSSWAAKHTPFDKWLAEQIVLLYDVPKKLARRWVHHKQLLPLLDGLDEMDAANRVKCIEEINRYRQNSFGPLVVCCRTGEYEEAAKQKRLRIQGAIIVQPLRQQQIDAYLAQAGRPLNALRREFTRNAALQKLARTPLMLSILVLIYQGHTTNSLSHQDMTLQRQVWETYVQRMVTQKGDVKRYPLEFTRFSLQWLASQMRIHNQTIFFLEQLQPDWIPPEFRPLGAWSQRIVQQWLRAPQLAENSKVQEDEIRETVFAGIYCMLFGGFIASWIFGPIGFIAGLFLILLGEGCFVRVYNNYSQINEDKQKIIFSESFARLLPGVIEALPALILCPWAGSFLNQPLDALAQRAGITMITQIGTWLGIVIGLGLSGLFFCFYNLAIILIKPAKPLAWLWKQTILNLALGFLIALPLGLLFGFLTTPLLGLLLAFLIEWYQFTETLPAKILTEEQFRSPNEGIRRTIKQGLFIGLLNGLLSGVTCSVVAGILNKSLGTLDSQHLTTVIQVLIDGGMLTGSARNLNSQFLQTINQVLNQAQNLLGSYGLLNPLLDGLVVGFGISIITGSFSGLLSVVGHILVRLRLKHTRCLPWNAQRFLDDATARVLLRRIGGGYSFTHRLLLDYFANFIEETPLIEKQVNMSSTQWQYQQRNDSLKQ